jgi:hypothetical protein
MRRKWPHFVGSFHEKAGRVKRKVEQVLRDGFLVSSVEKSARFRVENSRTQNGTRPTCQLRLKNPPPRMAHPRPTGGASVGVVDQRLPFFHNGKSVERPGAVKGALVLRGAADPGRRGPFCKLWGERKGAIARRPRQPVIVYLRCWKAAMILDLWISLPRFHSHCFSSLTLSSVHVGFLSVSRCCHL